MSERLVQIGESGALHGVLCTPSANRAGGASLLLFNAGVVHRIGAHRLNVKIARAMQKEGAPSLRFDLSGLGESPAKSGGVGHQEQATIDISAAVDLLSSEAEAQAVVSLGMCSGADNGYRAALNDERIKGLILLDPYAYPNRMAAAEDMLARAASPERWMRKAASLMSAKSDNGGADAVEDLDQARPLPPRTSFGADLKRLTDGGVRILIVYTGFVRSMISRPSHFFSIFPEYDFGSRIDVVTMPEIDHTYTELSAQSALIGHVGDWLKRHFPLAGGAE